METTGGEAETAHNALMTPLRPVSSRYRSLQASQRALAKAAPLVRFGLLAVGAGVFLDQVRPLVSDAQFTWGERRVMGVVALVVFSSFGMAAWAAGMLLRAASELIEVFVDGAEAAVHAGRLVEAQVVPNLARAATALERLAAAGPVTAPTRDAKAAAEVRQAIREGRWGRAARLLQDFLRDQPGSPEAASLAAELERSRTIEADDLRARLDAARASDDPESVIDCRDALTRHLDGEALHELDRRVVSWLAGRVRARVKGGSITPETAALAERVADSFGDTTEGRELLAWLPELRRRAGLCPICARPYRGKADACPACLNVVPVPPRPPAGPHRDRGE